MDPASELTHIKARKRAYSGAPLILYGGKIMTNIEFSLGTYKEYQLNGKNTIRVNVSDPNIIKRLKDCGEKIDKLESELDAEASYDKLFEADATIRQIIDEAIDCPGACDAAFGAINCLAAASNGQPVYYNFLEALLSQLKKDIQEVNAKPEPEPVIPETLDQSPLNNERTRKYLEQPTITASSINVNAMSMDEREKLLKELLAAGEKL